MVQILTQIGTKPLFQSMMAYIIKMDLREHIPARF